MRSFVEEEERESTDTEITLGMKSLLGVFFGSVLVCGVFFGFGYSLGRGNARPSATVAAPPPAIAVQPASASDGTVSDETSAANDGGTAGATESAAASSGQPAGGELKTIISDSASATPNPASGPQYDYMATPQGPARKPAGAPLRPLAKPRAGIVSAPPAAADTSTTPTPAPALTAAKPALVSVPVAGAPNATADAAPTMVQIAAVSHQEDANILVAALRRRGYSVIVRNEPKDSLLHVQIGPFASRDQAKAMRARLLADGYNAILK